MDRGNPLNELFHRQLEFSPEPHQSQLGHANKILMVFHENALMQSFQRPADLLALDTDPAGWYSSETMGPAMIDQLISALGRYIAATKDELTRLRAIGLVEAYENL